MTTKKNLKRRVRSLAAETGEPYTVALRKVREQQQDSTPVPATAAQGGTVHCSFCGKPDSTVDKIVAGPGVYICNQCVDLSATIIAETAHDSGEESARRRSRFYDLPAEDVLAMLPTLARSAARVEADLTGWIGRLRGQGIEWQAIADAVGTTADDARARFEPESTG